MYAKVNGQQLVQYPYTMQHLRAEYPDTLFPANMTTEQFAEFGMVPVVATGAPQYDPLTQAADEAMPAYVAANDRWEIQWTVRAATTEEIDSYKQSLLSKVVDATQKRLDDFARTRGYDGILSACTYSDSLVQKFRNEGQYCLAQRDATWAKLYEMLAEVEAGTRPMPTSYADVEPELPVLAWPSP